MPRGRPGWASRSERFGTYRTAFAADAWNAGSGPRKRRPHHTFPGSSTT